jgi:hypothetical protein
MRDLQTIIAMNAAAPRHDREAVINAILQAAIRDLVGRIERNDATPCQTEAAKVLASYLASRDKPEEAPGGLPDYLRPSGHATRECWR